LISGNVNSAISPSQGNDGAFVFSLTIQNNLIGCDRTGTNALGNGDLGIAAPNGGVGGQGFSAHDCLIADNVFVANGQGGLEFAGNNNLFVRNKIGIGADRVTPMGNHGAGINLAGNTNRVGTTIPTDANIIAFNNGPGVHLLDGTGHAVLGNSIFGNNGLGIDLGGLGRNDNDADDADDGPNHLQNFPVLDAVNSFSSGSAISGSLNSASNSQYRLEFFSTLDFASAGQPQAAKFLSSTNVTTDSTGNVNFSAALAADAQGFITATATDANGNTSEISAGIPLARLDIVKGAQVRLVWRTNLSNFSLQANGDVTAPAGWTNVPGVPGTTGSNFFHDVTPIDPALFFRLKRQ